MPRQPRYCSAAAGALLLAAAALLLALAAGPVCGHSNAPASAPASEALDAPAPSTPAAGKQAGRPKLV